MINYYSPKQVMVGPNQYGRMVPQPVCPCGHVNTKDEPVYFWGDTETWHCGPCHDKLLANNPPPKENHGSN